MKLYERSIDRIEAADLDRSAADVAPFLENAEDVRLLTPENFARLLG